MVSKNKVGVPKREGGFRIAETTDDGLFVGQCIEKPDYFGYIDSLGLLYKKADRKKELWCVDGCEQIFSSKKEAETHIVNTPQLYRILRDKIVQTAGNTAGSIGDGDELEE